MSKSGPRTAAGKAVVSRNAFKHGIHAGYAVIDGIEDPAEWEAIRDGVRESFEPANYAEELIAERIALNLWKRRRVDVYQAATARRWIDGAYSHLQVVGAYEQRTLAKGELPEPDERDLYIEERVRLLGTSDDIQRVMRYDAHLHRQTLQLMHELEAMQARRRGENAPLARVDINGPPGA